MREQQLRNVGAAVLVISEDLDEVLRFLLETDRRHPGYNHDLSKVPRRRSCAVVSERVFCDS